MSQNKRNYHEQEYEKRIWLLVFLCFITVSLINMGMLIILKRFLPSESLPAVSVNACLIYSVLVAIVETVSIYFTVKKNLLNPISKLKKAASQVARGDFSVYVEPRKMSFRNFPIDSLIGNFNLMVDELASLETLKADFISNVSHEIRTPLGNIKNYAYALKDPNTPMEIKAEYADIIIEASDSLNVLVTNMLRLNKMENQMTKPVIEEYDLCEQLSECILSFEKIWSEKDIEIELDTEDRAVIEADKDMLRIVWVNLLSNAFKFTESGGKVSVRQSAGENSVTISIADTGCGMNEETRRRMFDKFYQGDTSHSGEGNGLGLSLVLRIMQLMKGELFVESEMNKGTTFVIKLPRKYCTTVY